MVSVILKCDIEIPSHINQQISEEITEDITEQLKVISQQLSDRAAKVIRRKHNIKIYNGG